MCLLMWILKDIRRDARHNHLIAIFSHRGAKFNHQGANCSSLYYGIQLG